MGSVNLILGMVASSSCIRETDTDVDVFVGY